jgi:hypothetical protein
MCVGKRDVMIYERTFTLPPDFVRGRVILHVGACDQYARVYVNDIPTGEEHVGGYLPIELDVTSALHEGENFSIYSLHYVNNHIQKAQGRVMLRGFSLKERVFLVKDGQWIALSGKSSFIKHFKAHKEALNSYCKEKKLLFKKGNHSDWSAFAAYCETLIRK